MRMCWILILGVFLFSGEIVSGASSSSIANAIKLKVNGPVGTDETVVRFLQGCNDNYNNGFDAQKLISPGPVPSIFTKDSSGTKLAINALASINRDRHIPVYLIAPVAGHYTLNSVILGSFSQDVRIILEDLSTGIKSDITQGACIYNTAVPLTAQSAPVFTLHFIVPPEIVSISDFLCSTGTKGKFLFQKASDEQQHFSLVDSVGQIILYSITGDSNHVADLDPGDYRLKVFFDSLFFTETLVTIGEVEKPAAEFICHSFNIITGMPVTLESVGANCTSYQWLKQGEILSNQKMLNHTFSSPGTYLVELKVTSGICRDSVSKELVVDAVTALEDEASTYRSIVVNGNTIPVIKDSERIILMDITGKQILDLNRIGSENHIELNLSAGVYILRSGDMSLKFYLNN